MPVGTMGAMRIPLLWLWRLLLGGFAVVYLASETLQSWLPPLLPFLAAVAVEAQFFVAGMRQGRRPALELLAKRKKSRMRPPKKSQVQYGPPRHPGPRSTRLLLR